MSFNEVIMWVMAAGALAGAADKILGNRLGLGEKFDEGFQSIGPLALGMTGIVCLTPVISRLLGPAFSPALRAVHADPALLGGLIANDMGGYALAQSLAEDPQAGLYAGLFISAMLGAVIVFHFPVGFAIAEKEDAEHLALGFLFGLITIPAGTFAGGLLAGFSISMLVRNTLPVLAFSVLLAAALKLKPRAMVKACTVFGKFITAVSYIGIATAAFEYMTGKVLIPGMTPIEDALAISAGIGVVLLGTFPVLSLISGLLKKPLSALGEKAGLDSASVTGLIFCLANVVPVYPMMKEMKKRGIVVNAAWAVSASAAFGDHLGFTASVEPRYISPVIAGKLVAGILAVLLAYACTKPDGPDRNSQI